MEIETYEVTEMTTGQCEEIGQDAIDLIAQLGLKGQEKLVRAREAGGDTTQAVCPYRRMTAEELRVYGALMTRHQKMEEYSDGPIPLRILQVAAHAKSWYKRLEVWCPEPGVLNSDPVLVGIQAGRHEWMDEPCLLARWGSELEPFEGLKEKAARMLRATWEAKAKEAQAYAAGLLGMLDAKVAAFLNGTGDEPQFPQ